MDNKKYLSYFHNVVKCNNSLKFTIIALIIVILIEGFYMVDMMKSQKTIIIPGIKETYVISDKTANKNYIIKMSTFFVDLVENFSPRTVKRNYQLFLSYVDAKSYGSMQSDLMALAQSYISNDTSSWFVVDSIMMGSGNTVYVIGRKHLIVGNKIVSENRIKITIKFVIKNGLFKVVSYEEKKISNVG